MYASERLRLETEPTNMIGRVIDIAAPIGKGQRGLIVSPPKAGKTMVMQSIANSITSNNPECHLRSSWWTSVRRRSPTSSGP